MSKPPRLTEREKTLLAALVKYNIMEDGPTYYCLGGYGRVLIRYHFRTLPRFERMGLAVRRGYWTATDAGREILAQIDGAVNG